MTSMLDVHHFIKAYHNTNLGVEKTIKSFESSMTPHGHLRLASARVANFVSALNTCLDMLLGSVNGTSGTCLSCLQQYPHLRIGGTVDRQRMLNGHDRWTMV